MTNVGLFLQNYLDSTGGQQKAIGEAMGIGEGHFSSILKGKRKLLRPNTLNSILAKLPENKRATFMKAYALDQFDEQFHKYLDKPSFSASETSGKNRDEVSELADQVRLLFPRADRAAVVKILSRILLNASKSKEMLSALDLLAQLEIQKK